MTWETSQGKTSGVVKKKLTKSLKIKTHRIAASKDNPEYLVVSSRSGKPAAHKAKGLHKTSSNKKTTKKKAAKKK